MDPKLARLIEHKGWKLHHKLGQGAYGKVFKAENLDSEGLKHQVMPGEESMGPVKSCLSNPYQRLFEKPWSTGNSS